MAKSRRSERFINRELSWLEFNQRILDLANDPSTPLLERGRFLGITASNLDEFFMVRVGGLQMLREAGRTRQDFSGMSPARQLKGIAERTHRMSDEQAACYRQVSEELAGKGIVRLTASGLSEKQRDHGRQVFEREVYPVVSPVALTGTDRQPLLANRVLHVAVRLKGSDGDGTSPRLAVLPLGGSLSRIIALPVERSGHAFMLLEDLVSIHAKSFFPGEKILEVTAFRITRNADMSVREDLAGDLLAEMSAVLDARKRSACVRLELDQFASKTLEKALVRFLRVPEESVYRSEAPVNLTFLGDLCDIGGQDSLLHEPWPPQMPPELTTPRPMFDLLSQGDILLYQPFDSFEPVVRFVEEAAEDPDVLAIKQVLYRTSRNSPITSALMRAAQKGKYVTAIVELKARFDEARNIEWAQEMEDAGVQVVYGVKKLKTHSKICLVVRREPGGVRRYMHFGTGNYNETTARLYTDVSYLTTDNDLGADASSFFNAVTGYSQPQQYLKLEAAPMGLRDRIIEVLRSGIEHARQGNRVQVKAKVNSLVDPKVIETLYEASKAGVRVDLNVRGICCLRPGVKGLSEHISVVSIVDRCLEHSRIFCLSARGEDQVYFSSADWMPRNFDRRVELLVPVDEPACRDRLIRILDTCLADNVNAWELKGDGTYERRTPPSRRMRVRSQETLYQAACQRVADAKRARPTVFEPHLPPKREGG